MKLDILALAAHPDDVELSCAGTLVKAVSMGKKAGIVDFTQGELGTRGTPEIRMQEAQASAKIMGLSARENLGFRDGFFTNDEAHQLEVIKMIRKYRPEIVLANAISDRHSDHGRASELAREACFLAGLTMIKTEHEGQKQEAWRPKTVYHYIQSIPHDPDIIVDVSSAWSTKLAAIKAFKSQFHDPESKEPATYISSPEFLNMIEARGIHYGHEIGVKYGEGFTVERTPGVSSIFDLV
ncbi:MULTISPECIES: bacillithiol biosynthesis deacetylase BshB1 [Roseivirga]|uniref:Bacillithiol biosynthesis deacetylase BshB1 n=1 Tax=Roseivirga thermotolerans TaxID=1758176 RepID=A0ABQ3I4U0_9BACT|nr:MULTISPECIES: bacillithiol biosynthesis deacetylase BshB1 [Roseivirga]MEC7753325.1 bacillithiol biosynthesis deacetylase BshB1 [Bacteroidota bacterium]GHE64093.1 bacillithiol biosynthesis deacetylase BshB1 [Roseivirga thermotolerans]|tara:strand:+ start:5615 stop:6331 length:717 start_codon:yes stop_codon:yes gene_type:complete